MRRKIGVFIGEITSEYQQIVLKSIFKKAKSLNYDVFAFCNFGAYGDKLLYAEGEKGVIRIPHFSTFDAIIVAEDTFDIDGMESEIQDLIKNEAKCPVVYLRASNSTYYNIIIENQVAMADMTRHFIRHHGYRDICFMTGDMKSEDAQMRYYSFLRTMEEEGIPVTKHMIFFGDYWRTKGKEAVDWFMEGRATYPQAIICSNDFMAISVCDELKRRGARIPEDVCVSGYDDILEAKRYQPSITSFKAPFAQMGEKAVEMIAKVHAGMRQKRVEKLKPIMCLRESCGCGKEESQEDMPWLLNKLYVQDDNLKKAVFMTTDYQDAFEEEEYLRVAESYIGGVKCDKAYICMCNVEEKSFHDVENETHFSHEMVLKRVFTKDKGVTECEEKFLRENILPVHILEEEEPEGYLIFSIHHKNKSYGYMAVTFAEDEWPSSYVQVYVMGLANAIEDAFMHREVSSLEKIRALYHKDALTGIFNRRGFERHLRMLYEKYKEEGKYLSIVSIDMNGLKYINDNFGHSEGDEALCRLANVLRDLTEEGEICARIGGDEFSMLLYSDSRNRDRNFATLFAEAMREEEKRVQKPYPFSASYGICCLNEETDLSLISCMQLADSRMYLKKKEDKMRREDLI